LILGGGIFFDHYEFRRIEHLAGGQVSEGLFAVSSSVPKGNTFQEGTILSSLDELELRDTVFFKTLEAAKDHYKKVRADIASQEAGKHGRGNKVVDFGGHRPKRR
jgi:hypothetical protein